MRLVNDNEINIVFRLQWVTTFIMKVTGKKFQVCDKHQNVYSVMYYFKIYVEKNFVYGKLLGNEL